MKKWYIYITHIIQTDGQPGQIAYSATKGALCSMTLPMARDLSRHGIRVVTIAPGVFDSRLTRNMSDKLKRNLESDIAFPKRFGQPEEFARTVRWAVECSYVNGETIRVTGAGRLPGKL
jgi:3-hydroxyacyl-CoA dehydrogenase / 3-hydroxy-2-methylbutyryl-CoA dehydrogenase